MSLILISPDTGVVPSSTIVLLSSCATGAADSLILIVIVTPLTASVPSVTLTSNVVVSPEGSAVKGAIEEFDALSGAVYSNAPVAVLKLLIVPVSGLPSFAKVKVSPSTSVATNWSVFVSPYLILNS